MNPDGSHDAMTSGEEPLAAIFTPVYNGGDYLAECVESVLRQTYQHWEFAIINNCSTDGTREIAEHYAARDSRIRVYNQKTFVSSMQNHNFGFHSISPESKYCKVVHADDWLFPECLAKMVGLAERNPSVGVVAAYGLSMDRVVWDGLPLGHAAWGGVPFPARVTAGRDIGRWYLMGGPFIFGSPTTVLYRADLIRKRQPFYREKYPQWADLDACLAVLRESHFGFVHQVLTFTRWHGKSESWSVRDLNFYVVGQLEVMKTHGPAYLTPHEYQQRLTEVLREYHRFLGQSVFRRSRDRGFWRYHKMALRELGHPLGDSTLAVAAAKAFGEVMVYPARTILGVLSGTRGRPQPAWLDRKLARPP